MADIDPVAYDAWYETPFGSICHRYEREALLSLAAFRRGESVLDAGCGTGVYLRELKGFGLRLFGLDENEAMLRFAAGTLGGTAELAVGSLTSLPFKSLSFDKVLCVCALEFLADPARAFAEISRVLKGGGSMLLGFLNKNSPWALARMEKGKSPASIWHGARFYGLGDIGRIAGRLDMRLRGFKGAIFFPPEAEGKDASGLEALEASGRACCPSTAAFIAAVFAKPG